MIQLKSLFHRADFRTTLFIAKYKAQGIALGYIVYFLTMDLAQGTLQSCRHRYRVSFVPFSEAQVHEGYTHPNWPKYTLDRLPPTCSGHSLLAFTCGLPNTPQSHSFHSSLPPCLDTRGLPYALEAHALDSSFLAPARAINTVCLVSFLADSIKQCTPEADYSWPSPAHCPPAE